MSIKGFKINGNVEKVDYEALENKPFYSEYAPLTDILETKEYEFVDDEGMVYMSLEATSLPPIIEGTPYNFTFGDTTKQVTFVYDEDQEGFVAGNLSIVGSGDDTGEVYCIYISGYEGEYYVTIITTESAGTYTVGLSYITDNIPLILNGTYTFGEMGD